MDNCPFCGAEKRKPICKDDWASYYYETFFECGSEAHEETRTDECKDRQIANLKERLEAWRVMWEECMRMADKYNMEMYPEVKKLKDLGEI